MTASCERVRGRLSDYGREALSAPDRRAVREHLAHCAACRAEAATTDASLLFVGLPSEEIASEEVASVVAAVRAGIALKQAERRIERPARRFRGEGGRRVQRLAAAVALVLLTLSVPSGVRSTGNREKEPEARRAPAAAVSNVARPDAFARPPGGATIYDWNPGAGEPRVVWIVDGSLDI